MTSTLTDPETERLAHEVARLTGESLIEAVRNSLAERLERERQRRTRGVAAELDGLAKECAALPDLDMRTPDDIIGYDENGLWR